LQTCFTIYHWHTKSLSIRLELSISPNCSEDVFSFFQKQTNDSYRFISQLMYVLCMAGVHQRTEHSNYLWLKVKLKLINLYLACSVGCTF